MGVREGLPEDLVYLAMIESGFTPHAVSWANAVGPWQFISDTGRRYSLRIDKWIDERRDPIKSTVAAALYLKELYSLFNNDWYLAAAGYNAGENKILRAIGKYNTRDFWEMSKGSYLKRETKEYVPKLLAAGYSAAIAEPTAKAEEVKGLLPRAIRRIITPGTWLDDDGRWLASVLMQRVLGEGPATPPRLMPPRPNSETIL